MPAVFRFQVKFCVKELTEKESFFSLMLLDMLQDCEKNPELDPEGFNASVSSKKTF